MKSNSSLNPLYFQFTLFADYGPLRYLFFILCLLIYMTIISANVVIILTVCLEKSLHQPMYIFICSLSLNSLYGSAGFFPRFLSDLLSDTHFISRPFCFIQMYVIYSYAACELTILSIMAYDRLVAICQPLHYHSKMTVKTVTQLLMCAVLYPAVAFGFCVSLTVRLPLCGNKLHRVFCSNWPVVQLSCVDTTLNNVAGQFVGIIVFFPLFFILFSYLHILLVCRRSSSEFRGKALQTCLPHIVTFMTFTLCLFCEVVLSRFMANEVHQFVIFVLSLEFLIIPPINNPLVYGLSLPQIRRVTFRVLKMPKMIPAPKHKVQHAQKASNKAPFHC
ncbi:olfactory receptor 6N1-like [Centropristis striata]|uniref:olfactory receptor 6N1-like n=1 Tax=Centropristis striata TaxID=184440 RepID=UPI0027E03E95|nr:olfactory receptor 6N1-like [Centropristis striata]